MLGRGLFDQSVAMVTTSALKVLAPVAPVFPETFAAMLGAAPESTPPVRAVAEPTESDALREAIAAIEALTARLAALECRAAA